MDGKYRRLQTHRKPKVGEPSASLDPTYKAASDAVRDGHASQELEAQLGIVGERLVGQGEAAKVAELIRSL